MDTSRYKEAFSKLPQGVKAAEAYILRAESFSVAILDGKIDRYSVSETGGVCMRVDCGQMGYAYSDDPKEDPQRLIAQAVENAGLIDSPDEQSIFEGEEQYPPMPKASEALLKETEEEKIAAAFALEKLALAQDGRIERLAHCVVSTGVTETAIVNSLGLELSQSGGMATAYVEPVATIDGAAKDATGYQVAKSVSELDLEKIAKDAAKELFSQEGAQQPASGKYRALFKNEAMGDLLGVFSAMFSAENAQKGLSLLNGREGQQIAAPAISIVDDPACEKACYQSAFDDEGVAARLTQVVEQGVLKTLLHNRKTAKKANAASTGNGGKAGLSGPVTVAPSNFYIQPGETDYEGLLALLGDGVVISDISGLHAGCNPVSGDFSALARGYLVQGGKVAKPVEQITVSGNFLELLMAAEAVGSDLLFSSGAGSGAPSVLFSSLTVAGK